MIAECAARALRKVAQSHAERPRASRSEWNYDCEQRLKGENHPGTRTRGFGDQLSRSLRYIMANLLSQFEEGGT